MFQDGPTYGHGVKTDPQGNIFEGDWKDGKPVWAGSRRGASAMLPWFNEEPRGAPPARAPRRIFQRRAARSSVNTLCRYYAWALRAPREQRFF